MSVKLSSAALPLLLSAASTVPNLNMPSSDPGVLNTLANFQPQRPLDQNGIDVYGEIPFMRQAYAKTGNGNGLGGWQEAGYSILKRPDGSPIRTSTQVDFRKGRAYLNVPRNAFAVVHTHPQKGSPFPGPADADMDYPNYVYSGNALYVTVPHTNKFYKYDIDKWNLPK